MAVLSFNNLAKEFAGEYIFTNLSGSVHRNKKIAITGPNGIGKTTLLQLIAGILEPSDGTINKSGNLKIAYLQQEAIQAFAEKENTVYNEMLTVFSGLLIQQASLHELESKLNEGSDIEALLAEYGRKQEAFELAGGYEYELKIQQTLEGLGFGKNDWHMPLAHCSGGQKTRALLARLLLEKPDLLILDEPTNHLDAAAVEWLEGTLLRWEKAILMVSHDRYFLDVLATDIWEMNSNGLEKYRGNYSAFQHQRQERRERRKMTFDATMEFFLKELAYVKKYIDKKTDQAKGRLKRLIRHVKAVEIGGPEALDMKWNEFCLSSGGISGTKWSVRDTEQHIRQLTCKNPYTKPMKMEFNCADHLPHKIAIFRNAKAGYGKTVLCSLENQEILDNSRIALLGPNGSGKSTLLRSILGEIPLPAGSITMGSGVKPGYFAQAHDRIDPEKTVLEEIMRHKNGLLEAEARNYLGRFLFSNDDVFKKTDLLSGGERGRLTLAIMALNEVNFLILDEPTNHLDIQSREILEEALTGFPGAILMVSHDRYLIDRLATQIWTIENRRIICRKGGYSEYVQNLTITREKEKDGQNGKRTKNKHRGKGPLNPEREIEQAEQEITSLEEELELISSRLEELVNKRDFSQMKKWEDRYREIKNELQVLLTTWEKLSEGVYK